MTKLNKISIAAVAFTLIAVVIGCNMSTANMSGLTVSKDSDGKMPATSFKNGDTLYARAPIANNPGKVKVKFYLVADDVKQLKKGETLTGSEVSVDLDGDGVATYSVPVKDGFPAGKYTLNADMINDAGEKKDGKTSSVTIETSAATDSDTSEPVENSDDN